MHEPSSDYEKLTTIGAVVTTGFSNHSGRNVRKNKTKTRPKTLIVAGAVAVTLAIAVAVAVAV